MIESQLKINFKAMVLDVPINFAKLKNNYCMKLTVIF